MGVAAGAALDGDNLGHQMLASMGWQGQGLGARGEGVVAPVSGGRPEEGKAKPGLGSADPTAAAVTDDAFELYKKRMSKGYQYRSAINQARPQNNLTLILSPTLALALTLTLTLTLTLSAINQAGPQNNFMPGTVPPPRTDRQ